MQQEMVSRKKPAVYTPISKQKLTFVGEIKEPFIKKNSFGKCWENNWSQC